MPSIPSDPPISPSLAPISVTGDSRRPGLLATVRERLRMKHYSLRTEEAYLGWIKRFVWFHGKCHPREMGAAEIAALGCFKKVFGAARGQTLKPSAYSNPAGD